MRKHVRTVRGGESGFSLLEVMVTVSIIGLLAGVVAVSVIKQRERANRQIADIDCKALRNGAIAWAGTHGLSECPTLERLIDDGVLDEGARGVDPWGQPMVIECKGERVSVRSAGPDRRLNTEDDVVAPPLSPRRP